MRRVLSRTVSRGFGSAGSGGYGRPPPPAILPCWQRRGAWPPPSAVGWSGGGQMRIVLLAQQQLLLHHLCLKQQQLSFSSSATQPAPPPDFTPPPGAIKLSKLLTLSATSSSSSSSLSSLGSSLPCPPSRRDAKRWVLEGDVTLAGVVVTAPNQWVTKDDVQNSSLRVRGKPIQWPNESLLAKADADAATVEGASTTVAPATRVWMVHKLAGELVTDSDPQGRPSLMERLVRGGVGKVGKGGKIHIKKKGRLHLKAIGRLDASTEGLILVTNDGNYAREMELPESQLHRGYRVRVHGRVDESQLQRRLGNGMTTVDGFRYGPMKVYVDPKSAENGNTNKWIEITCTEGKNRQIRKVLDSMGLTVTRLIRTSYGDYSLGTIPPGMALEVTPKRVETQKLKGPLFPPRRSTKAGDSGAEAERHDASRGTTTADDGATPRRDFAPRHATNVDDGAKPRRDFAPRHKTTTDDGARPRRVFRTTKSDDGAGPRRNFAPRHTAETDGDGARSRRDFSPRHTTKADDGARPGRNFAPRRSTNADDGAFKPRRNFSPRQADDGGRPRRNFSPRQADDGGSPRRNFSPRHSDDGGSPRRDFRPRHSTNADDGVAKPRRTFSPRQADDNARTRRDLRPRHPTGRNGDGRSRSDSKDPSTGNRHPRWNASPRSSREGVNSGNNRRRPFPSRDQEESSFAPARHPSSKKYKGNNGPPANGESGPKSRYTPKSDRNHQRRGTQAPRRPAQTKFQKMKGAPTVG